MQLQADYIALPNRTKRACVHITPQLETRPSDELAPLTPQDFPSVVLNAEHTAHTCAIA